MPSCLDMANPEDGKKKGHNITATKRSSADQLRFGAPKSLKVMLVRAKACVTNWRRKNNTAGLKSFGLESIAADIVRDAENVIDTAFQRATRRTQRFIRRMRVWI